MLELLKDKAFGSKIIIAALPLMAVANTCLKSAVLGAIALLTLVLTALCLALLSRLLTLNTAKLARLVIAVGISGILSMLFSLFANELVGEIKLYVPLICVTSVLLVDCDLSLSAKLSENLKAGAGIGTAVFALLFVSGVIRELFGMGSFFGISLPVGIFAPVEFMKQPSGALLTAAFFCVLYYLFVKIASKRGEGTK